MDNYYNVKEKISNDGFAIIDNVFSEEETENLLFAISQADDSRPTFRKSKNLFAIRQFLTEIPTISDQVFNSKLIHIISDLFGNDFFVVKSIYFDKPEDSNWFVSYHQDLTI